MSTLPDQAMDCSSLLPHHEDEGVYQSKNVIGEDCSIADHNSATVFATGAATDVIVAIPDTKTSMNTAEIKQTFFNNVEKKTKWRRLSLLKTLLFRGIFLISLLVLIEVITVFITPMLWIKDPQYVYFVFLAFVKGTHIIIIPYLILSTPEIKDHAYNNMSNYAKAICNFFNRLVCARGST